jgi:hypothetical protein
MHLDVYLGLQHRTQTELQQAFTSVGQHHQDEPDIAVTCAFLASACAAHVPALKELTARYGEGSEEEAEAIYKVLFHGPRSGGVGLLRDLQDLYLLASMCDITWKMLRQAGLGLRDDELSALSGRALRDTSLQLSWLLTRMKTSAPQALVVG